MTNNSLHSISSFDVCDFACRSYDVFFTTLGFEERARHIAEHYLPQATRRIANAFTDRKVCSYHHNHLWYKNNNYEIVDVEDDLEFYSWIKGILTQIPKDRSGKISVCADISSMSRLRIAGLVAAIADLQNVSQVDISFVYSNAKFTQPAKDSAQIEAAGPVLPRFAGWSVEPDKPSSVVLGLGYEYDKAIGALDYIEPAEVWAFYPVSSDERYDIEMLNANRILWPHLQSDHRISYPMARPVDCFFSLESLVYGLVKHSRPVLVPFGPKIFTLNCLLVACAHFPNVAVWRVSSGSNEQPVNREADGTILGVNAVFQRMSSEISVG